MSRLLRLAAGQIGNLVNLSEWASLCGVSRDTVAEYLQILEDAHILVLLPVYAAGRRAELTASSKVYFVDNGLRNALLGDWRGHDDRLDAGQLWENWVFSEILKTRKGRHGLHYWRTRSGAEVDFVLDDGRTLTGIEVKAAALSTPRLSKSSRSFINAYHPTEFLVLNGALDHSEELGGTRVRWTSFGTFTSSGEDSGR